MNSRIEVRKLEPGPSYEKTINEINNNLLKSMSSATTNLSAITLFENRLEPLSMRNSF